jgi:hypothetical protein
LRSSSTPATTSYPGSAIGIDLAPFQIVEVKEGNRDLGDRIKDNAAQQLRDHL